MPAIEGTREVSVRECPLECGCPAFAYSSVPSIDDCPMSVLMSALGPVTVASSSTTEWSCFYCHRAVGYMFACVSWTLVREHGCGSSAHTKEAEIIQNTVRQVSEDIKLT